MRYILALFLVSTSALADRYISDGNGGFYVYHDRARSTGQMFSDFGNRGGLISRMEQNRQIQLENALLQRQIEQLEEIERLKRQGRE